jgi:hypothetical protein
MTPSSSVVGGDMKRAWRRQGTWVLSYLLVGRRGGDRRETGRPREGCGAASGGEGGLEEALRPWRHFVEQLGCCYFISARTQVGATLERITSINWAHPFCI